MAIQNNKNHRQFVPSYHFVTFGGLITLLVSATISYFNVTEATEKTLALLIAFGSLIMLSIALHTRGFSLRAQDRAIRAEENFRYFVLTGKRIDTNITMGQIIALRFASDEEFVSLTAKALAKKLKPSEIKLLIVNWRADLHRL